MIEVEAQISIRRDGAVFLTPLKSELLQEIRRSGSLSKAAQNLCISYQHAWTMIDELNRISPHPIVNKQRGGSHGGGAELSDYGNKILKEYKSINDAINRTVNQINTEINL